MMHNRNMVKGVFATSHHRRPLLPAKSLKRAMVTDLRTGMLMAMRLTLSLTALALLTGCGAAPTPVPPPAPVAVETQLLALRPLDLVEILPASVTADRVVTLQARVAGLVTRIDAVPGTRVAAGTVIAHLDAAELDARSAQATAQAAQAAADLERATSLVARQALTPAEFDAAKARAAATAAAAKEATILVGYTTLTAPFEAVILRRHAEIGDLLAPGRPVADLEDPASLRLEVAVPESLAARVAPGTTLAVEVAAAGLAVIAPVVEVTPAADPASRTVRASLALPPTVGLRSGQFGRVTVPVAAGERLFVPQAAVRRHGQIDSVLVAEDGHARLRLVRLGEVSGTEVAIRAGLAAGELLILNAPSLADGSPIIPR
jgi:RND family efflux transporter MFP subunit